MTLSPALEAFAVARQNYMTALANELKTKDDVKKARNVYRLAKEELRAEDNQLLDEMEQL